MVSYEAAVTEARGLVKRSEEDQWRLAELTWEQVEAGATLQQWANDIGRSRATADRYYKVWSLYKNYPAGNRPPFSEARVEIDPSTGEQARIERGIRGMDPERKAEVISEILRSDPDLAKKILEDESIHESTRRVPQPGEPDPSELTRRIQRAVETNWAGMILDACSRLAHVWRSATQEEILDSIRNSDNASHITRIIEEDAERLLTLTREARQIKVAKDA